MVKNIVVLFSAFILCNSTSIFAYSFKPTELEYLSWSEECKSAYKTINDGRDFIYGHKIPSQRKDLKNVIWKSGYWHYCGGKVKIQRAKTEFNTKKRIALYRQGISNAFYTYERINKAHWLAADVGVTIAEGYRNLDKVDDAKEFLDSTLVYHPEYVPAHLTYAMIFFDGKDFEAAKKRLLKANKISNSESSEINYFLGLVSLNLNEMKAAKAYAEKAEKLGYPLSGLKNKIKQIENLK